MILVLQLLTSRRDGLGVMGLAYVVEHATNRETEAHVAHTRRIEVRRVEVLVVGVQGRVGTRRPVMTARAPIVKASRVPAIVATTRERKRFGENTGIGSGERTLALQVCSILIKIEK